MAAPSEPTGRRRGVVALVVGAAAGLALVALFARSGRRPPDMPADVVHRASDAERRAEPCLTCHARDAALPVSSGHTGRRDCSSCHVVAR